MWGAKYGNGKVVLDTSSKRNCSRNSFPSEQSPHALKLIAAALLEVTSISIYFNPLRDGRSLSLRTCVVEPRKLFIRRHAQLFRHVQPSEPQPMIYLLNS
jgi:hypothetical protein